MSRIFQNQKYPRMSRNVQKCPEMSRNVQKCPKKGVYVIYGCPHYRQRIENLLDTLDNVVQTSDARHKESKELTDDLKKANR